MVRDMLSQAALKLFVLEDVSTSLQRPLEASPNLVAATNRPGRSGAPRSIFKTNSSGLSATVTEIKEITEALVEDTERGVMLTPRRGASGMKSENSCQEAAGRGYNQARAGKTA